VTVCTRVPTFLYSLLVYQATEKYILYPIISAIGKPMPSFFSSTRRSSLTFSSLLRPSISKNLHDDLYTPKYGISAV